jgi:multidrug efflux pump subunit AcrB
MYASSAVYCNLAPGVSSSEGIKLITEAAADQGVNFEWTEASYLQQQEGSSGMLVFGLGSLLVFLVLAAKYESWSLPLSVILVVPMCLLSATIGVLIAHLDVNIFVLVGLIVLVGMAAKNAILIVEFAKTREDEGVPCHEATVEACRDRLRPIVMTSFAFILGVVPLVLAHGAGAEMRHGLGVAVFAGMLGVTLFGIFLTPVFYFVIMNLTRTTKQ